MKEFAHLNMSHHPYCTVIQVHPCFRNEKCICDTVITFLQHCSALNTVWAYVFKDDITYIALVRLYISVIYLHSLQWFSWLMSAVMERCAAHSFIPVHVGKKWSSIAIAAIVLCTTMLIPVIAVTFCTFIQFWYLMAFFGKMSCVIDM